MRPVRWTLAALTPLPILLASACAGGPGPDLSGPDGAAIKEAYSGTWTLVPEESESFQDKLDEAVSTQRSGGMRGGGGRRGGGMRGGMQGGMDPGEMERVVTETRRLGELPQRVTLSLEENSASLTLDASPPLTLVLGAEPTVTVEGVVEMRSSAAWTASGLEIRREVRNGASVFDTYVLDESGGLRLRRDVRMLRGQTEFRIRALFRREDTGL